MATLKLKLPDVTPFYITPLIIGDDDRRLVASDVTAYVNKNQFRVVQFPFKVRISKTDYVKRVIGDKPV